MKKSDDEALFKDIVEELTKEEKDPENTKIKSYFKNSFILLTKNALSYYVEYKKTKNPGEDEVIQRQQSINDISSLIKPFKETYFKDKKNYKKMILFGGGIFLFLNYYFKWITWEKLKQIKFPGKN